MATLTLLQKIKLSLRINHNALDDLIASEIDVAKAEMERNGILPSAIVDTDDLISEAIKTYVQYLHSDDLSEKEGFFGSWTYQLDCLRKTEAYINV